VTQITIIVGLFTILSSAFALGSLWSTKQDKRKCDSVNAKFTEAIVKLTEALSEIRKSLAVMEMRQSSIEKRMDTIEDRINDLITSIDLKTEIQELRRHVTKDRPQ
jgi:chromosome segregation ATPase